MLIFRCRPLKGKLYPYAVVSPLLKKADTW